MQALQKKNAASQALRDVLAGADGTIQNKGIDERVEHCKNLQYKEHQPIFAVLYSTIHKAASDNSISGIKHFLNSRQKPKIHVDDYDQHGLCPLHLASEKGCNDAVSFIIVDSHCDVDIRTTYGNTPMMYACKDNQLDTIRLLHGLGAKMTLRNKAGQSALHYAAQSDHVEAIKLVVELTAEHRTQRELQNIPDDTATVDTSTTYEDSVKEKSIRGGTVIGDDDSVTVASVSDSVMSEGDAELMAILNITANNGMTPLHLACLFNSTRCVEYLLSMGVKVNCVDSSGDTPLHKAGKKSYHALYKTLLIAGANEDIKNQFGDKASDLLRDNAFY